MDEKSLFTRFWTDESKTTRNVLARIPDGSDYRPDPKSRTAQEIAWQIVGEEQMINEALESGRTEWAPPPTPASMKDVLAAYEQQSAGMPARWQRFRRSAGPERSSSSATVVPPHPWPGASSSTLSTIRGQITTYLRPMGSTVPQIYGPSADEP